MGGIGGHGDAPDPPSTSDLDRAKAIIGALEAAGIPAGRTAITRDTVVFPRDAGAQSDFADALAARGYQIGPVRHTGDLTTITVYRTSDTGTPPAAAPPGPPAPLDHEAIRDAFHTIADGLSCAMTQ